MVGVFWPSMMKMRSQYGGAVQVDPIKPMLKAPEINRLKL